MNESSRALRTAFILPLKYPQFLVTLYFTAVTDKCIVSMWDLTLRGEHGLRVFENRVLR
jgi:hypothetical protein